MHPNARAEPANRRSLPEQAVGLAIIALAAFSFLAPAALFSQEILWPSLVQHALFAFSFWAVWRRRSLRTLKIELSVFLAMFIFEAIWRFSFYQMRQPLPSLIALLLWMSSAIALAALFWKKEKLAFKILLIPLLGIFYFVSLNMMLSIATP